MTEFKNIYVKLYGSYLHCKALEKLKKKIIIKFVFQNELVL